LSIFTTAIVVCDVQLYLWRNGKWLCVSGRFNEDEAIAASSSLKCNTFASGTKRNDRLWENFWTLH